MSKKSHLQKVSSFIPKYHMDRLRKIAKLRKISIARLIAVAIDHELEMERPFKFEVDLPVEEYLEYAYAEEAGKIITHMNTMTLGAGLDILVLLRFDIGIPDKDIFLKAFKECLDKDMIESFPAPVRDDRPPPAEGYLYYCIKGHTPKDKKKLSRNAKQFGKYHSLKKKFEKEGEG